MTKYFSATAEPYSIGIASIRATRGVKRSKNSYSRTRTPLLTEVVKCMRWVFPVFSRGSLGVRDVVREAAGEERSSGRRAVPEDVCISRTKGSRVRTSSPGGATPGRAGEFHFASGPDRAGRQTGQLGRTVAVQPHPGVNHLFDVRCWGVCVPVHLRVPPPLQADSSAGRRAV